PVRRLFRSLFITHRSLTLVFIFWLSMSVVAISTGFWLTWRLVYAAMIGVPIAYIWSRLNLAGLNVVADRSADRLQEGGEFDERITVTNRSWLAKIWLEINDPSEMPGHQSRRIVTVPAKGSKWYRAHSHIRRRGLSPHHHV